MFRWWRKNVIDRVHAAAHSGNFAIKVAFSVLYCLWCSAIPLSSLSLLLGDAFGHALFGLLQCARRLHAGLRLLLRVSGPKVVSISAERLLHNSCRCWRVDHVPSDRRRGMASRRRR